MRFLPFPKISTVASGGPSVATGSWVAQEKIHGAQLVVGVARDEVCFGKRKAWLAEDESFFGWQLLRSELADAARGARARLDLRADDELYLYGELFGGHYPHPSVAKVVGLSAVQTGIWYAPDIRWCVFDAVVCPAGDQAAARYLSQGALATATAATSILHPPTLARGRRSELQFLATRFPTKLPAMLGLPPIDANWAEGLVIKPDGELPAGRRPIEKRKIEEFDEKRFDESAAWDAAQPLTPAALSAWSLRLLGPARFASARSKVGDGDPEALLDEVVLDVLVDLAEAFPAAMARLSGEDEGRLAELLRQDARLRLPPPGA
jgi:Rnl2 family RNA ligase